MTTTLTHPAAPPAGSSRSRFRTDIEGLRAIAVLGVVLFHAGVPTVTGGFVGVDVFFVISGFLITGLLIREHERTGRIRLGAFYARRARRLLPPAALVIAVSAVATWFVLPLLGVFRSAFDLLAALFYVSNWRFIAQGNDYLAASSDHSVALHFWSLAVEEQFYLVWPALLIGAFWVAARTRWSPRTATVVAVSVVTAGSFAASLWLTYTHSGLAYMATYTRAWQFGAGALLALGGTWLASRTFAADAVGFVGLLSVLASMVVFGSHTPYPGWAAVVPTLGTVALIAAGPRSVSGQLLSIPPLRIVGRWSYSWYLWHWPVLVVAEAYLGELSWSAKLALSGVSLALAAATHLLVEAPLMRSRDLQARAPAAAAVGLTATVVAAAIVLATGTRAVDELSTGAQAPTAASFSQVFGTATTADSGAVTPMPIDARADIPERADCLLDRTSTQPDCTFGVSGGIPVVLFGDSHAHQWQPTLQVLAEQRGWELTVIAQSGCPVPDIAPRAGESARFSQSHCTTWRDEQIDRIVAMRPSLIVLSSLNMYIPQHDELLGAWAGSLDRLRESGARIAYIRDTPYPGTDVPECISSALDDWSACAFEASGRVDPVIAGTTSGRLTGVAVVDLNGYLCDGTDCAAVRNGTLLYRDESHLSATAARLLAPALSDALDRQGIR
ncbi:acyltransferase family protein [Rhodococcus triatomae]